MTNSQSDLEKKIAQYEQAKHELEEAIFAAIADKAAELELDEIIFGHWNNTYEKSGKRVAAPEIDALEEVYLNKIASGGFLAAWSKTNGWVTADD